MKTIVVVDDEFDLVDILAVTLSGLGYDVHTADNGVEGLQTMRAHPPDLVILDCMMPLLDGPGVIAAMRADPSLAEVPVLLTSAMPENDISARCGGYSAFLRKPFDVDATLGAVKTVLGDRG
jgi:CheY-like chemotaxis protein